MQSWTAPSWPELQDSRPLVPLLIPSCAPLIYDSFCRCLNTFSKTWLIVSKLFKQANQTQHWEINHSHLRQTETQRPLITTWFLLASHENTFRPAATYLSTFSSITYPLHCLCSVPQKEHFHNKNETLRLKSWHYGHVFSGTSWSENSSLLYEGLCRGWQECGARGCSVVSCYFVASCCSFEGVRGHSCLLRNSNKFQLCKPLGGL